MTVRAISENNISRICRELSQQDEHLRQVFERYGRPPLWAREPGFGTLLNIILEQQVSLASAKACYDKLAAFVGEVTPEKLLAVSDADLRIVGFSRQKTTYARHLSEAVLEKRLDLDKLHKRSDEDVKAELTKLKGVGTWTADVYLLMAMLRPDVMPRGDIALHAAYQKLAGLEKRPASDEFLAIAETWRPYRSVAARLLWHFYLTERRKTER